MNTQEMQQEIEKILQEIEACSEKLDKAAKYLRSISADLSKSNRNDEKTAGLEILLNKYLSPEDDEIMRQALQIVLIERNTSMSYLQRRLEISFNQAAEILEIMEMRGIIGPSPDGSTKRDILIQA